MDPVQGTLAQLRASPRDGARWRQAAEHLLAGRSAAALGLYRDLVQHYPEAAELWFEMGNAAAGELDFALARRAYSRAVELAPANVSLLVSVGQQYQGLRRLDEARECFSRAAAADPASVDARISLAVWFEKERRLGEAWECVKDCLARHPRDDQARYFQAFLLHRGGQDGEAETVLRDLIKDDPSYPYVKYAARHLLGVVLDQVGNYAEAWRWLGEAKALVRQLTNIALLEREYDRGAAARRQLLASFNSQAIPRWRERATPGGDRYRFAFLGGHPRSGTTLLEQVLDAHPNLIAFDESPAIGQEVLNRITPPQFAQRITLGFLGGLSEDRRGDMRRRYLASLLREVEGDPAASVLLDKNPSPTSSLHLWLRVFPELKVIIALRDPRDVILSCYFQNLPLNATNTNFLSLDRAARHYADLMDVWLRLRDLGGFDWIETRYEDVVANLESEGRRVTEFLGLAWEASQAKYYESARRKFLFAPTYHDVTQPVYRRAMGRWHRYADAIEPLQPRLAAYCKAFGYDS